MIIDKETNELIDILNEGIEIIEVHTPINIKDKRPDIGQRCNVYDIFHKEWTYAHWQRDSKINYIPTLDCYQGIFEIYDPIMARDVYINATYWLPELPKPK